MARRYKILLSLTEEEKTEIEKQAKKEKVSMSELIRNRIFGEKE